MAILSCKHFFALLAFLFFMGSATALPSSVAMKNYISSCIEFGALDSVLIGSTPMISTSVKVKANVGVCGCKSAVGLYSVYLGEPNRSLRLIEGIIATKFLKSGDIQLPVALTANIAEGKKLTVTFSCQPPD